MSVNNPQLGNLSNVSVSTNESTVENTKQEFVISSAERTVLIAVNLTLSVSGTLGNMLIIFAVLVTPELRRKVSNFIILSLAVADLMVTMIAQPLFTVSVLLSHDRCDYVRVLEIVYSMVGNLSIVSSLFHLVSISIDRALCTIKPHRYRCIIKRWYKVMIGACWGVAAALACFSYLHRQKVHLILDEINARVKVIITLSGFAIMLCSYSAILYKIKSNRFISPPAPSAAVQNRSTENRVSATIGIVTLLFFLCWVVGIIHNLIEDGIANWCGMTIHAPNNFALFYTIRLCNSSMNFLVYSLRIRRFRVACWRVIMMTLCKFWQTVMC